VGTPCSFDLSVNGGELPGSSYGAISGGPVTGQAIVQLAAGDSLTLENISSFAVSIFPAGGVNASLQMERLGGVPAT
jgi:hypothetical protein